jgi:hypothetical protein
MESEFLDALQVDLARDRDAGEGSGARLVQACLDAVAGTGAGIMLMTDGDHRGTVGASDSAIAVVEELQFTLGEGPCIDTCSSGAPVLEPHLRDPDELRWHEFSEPRSRSASKPSSAFRSSWVALGSARSTCTWTTRGSSPPSSTRMR